VTKAHLKVPWLVASCSLPKRCIGVTVSIDVTVSLAQAWRGARRQRNTCSTGHDVTLRLTDRISETTGVARSCAATVGPRHLAESVMRSAQLHNRGAGSPRSSP
jgi:hypothetical protein